MCGIFGYYTFNVTKPLCFVLSTLFNGLKRLEYRGYDSAGVAFDVKATSASHEDGRSDLLDIKVVKEVGKVADLERLAYETLASNSVDMGQEFHSQVAIAHTRWATHGRPNAVNSHPQVSGVDYEFVVVHNGIITNYALLKEYLVKQGEQFVSETDTEVIPKLCKHVYAQLGSAVPFPKLVMAVVQKLEGAYAVLVKSTHYPGELVACKRGSPLVLGVRDEHRFSFAQLTDASDKAWRSSNLESWVASDTAAILEHTKKVIVLEDNDVLHLSGSGYGIYNTDEADVEEAVQRSLTLLDMEVAQLMKGGYEHYMQKEIHEQPESLQQTMRGRVQLTGEGHCRVKLGGLADFNDSIRHSRRLMLVGCGTSYYACQAARQTIEEMCELPVVLELSSDMLDRRCPIFRDDAVVFVSQSGETADTLRALEYAKACGALCIGITNTVGSAMSRSTHCGVHLNAGYEIGVASTKAYTSHILAMAMMVLQLSEDSIRKQDKRNTIMNELGRLPDKVRDALALDGAMRQVAEQLKSAQSMLFFARGRNYATALEAALKVTEVALIHSEGILAGEMKHGTLALVDEHLPIIVIATQDDMYKKMESVIQQLLARSARLYIVCNENDDAMKAYELQGCQLIQVPWTVDCLQPIVNIVPLQLLAYHLTVLRGHNVDQPRNLAKSVTVSEE